MATLRHPRHSFLIFCTSDNLARCNLKLSRRCESLRYSSLREHVLFLDVLTNTLFFSRVKNGLNMMVSGLNHLPGRVKRSDLLQSERYIRCYRRADTGPGVINRDSFTLGTFRKHSFGLLWACWGLWRLLEAKPNIQW